MICNFSNLHAFYEVCEETAIPACIRVSLYKVPIHYAIIEDKHSKRMQLKREYCILLKHVIPLATTTTFVFKVETHSTLCPLLTGR